MDEERKKSLSELIDYLKATMLLPDSLSCSHSLVSTIFVPSAITQLSHALSHATVVIFVQLTSQPSRSRHTGIDYIREMVLSSDATALIMQ